MVVLKVVYDNLNGRDIIFSSFHPDICMMLALKQVCPQLFPADVA
jgi:glycerophosphodiester phosphodiesterase